MDGAIIARTTGSGTSLGRCSEIGRSGVNRTREFLLPKQATCHWTTLRNTGPTGEIRTRKHRIRSPGPVQLGVGGMKLWQKKGKSNPGRLAPASCFPNRHQGHPGCIFQYVGGKSGSRTLTASSAMATAFETACPLGHYLPYRDELWRIVASLDGFEPPTFGFGDRRSTR